MCLGASSSEERGLLLLPTIASFTMTTSALIRTLWARWFWLNHGRPRARIEA